MGLLAAALQTILGRDVDFAALVRAGPDAPCPVLWYDPVLIAAGGAPLPADAPARVAATADGVLAGDDGSTLVRSAAKCAALLTGWAQRGR